MCNPSPQGRCPSDASKAVSSKLTKFEKAATEFYDRTEEQHIAIDGEEGFAKTKAKLDAALAEVNEAKAFLYATPSSQSDPLETSRKIDELESSLSPLHKSLLKPYTGQIRRTGKFLSKFQERARDYAKEHPEKSSLEVARYMTTAAFINTRGKINMELTNAYQEGLRVSLNNAPKMRHDIVKAQKAAEHRANVETLDRAYSYAVEDAKNTINKDITKNSATYANSIDKHKFGFYKREDGSFTVRTRFEVKAKDFGSAVEQVENSFGLEDVQITLSKPVNNAYTVDTSYVYKGGESLDDAKKFHQEAWKGTPQWRETLRQTKMLEDFYDQDNKQGKYAVK